MGKIVCENHGTQVVRFVSKFHQEKINRSEGCREADIIYVELAKQEGNIQGKFLRDPGIILHIEKPEKVLKMHPDSSEFHEIFSDLQAVCPTCVDEYLARKL